MILLLLSTHVVSCKGLHIFPRLIRSSPFSRHAKSIPREGETEGAGGRCRRSPSGICFDPDWAKVGKLSILSGGLSAPSFPQGSKAQRARIPCLSIPLVLSLSPVSTMSLTSPLSLPQTSFHI